MNKLFIFFVVLSGAGMAVQAAINAQLGGKIGGYPIFAAWWSFLIGGIALLMIGIFSGQISRQTLSAVIEQPWFLHIGGLMGALAVTMTILGAPRLGVAATAMLIIFGQLSMALLLDRFGLLGLTAKAIDWHKILGLGLVFFGVYLFNQTR